MLGLQMPAGDTRDYQSEIDKQTAEISKLIHKREKMSADWKSGKLEETEDLRAEGEVQEASGVVQGGFGKAKREVGNAIKDVGNAIKKP